MPIAKKTDWKTTPLPPKSVRLTYERAFSSAEGDKIKAGFLPQGMDDKWFIYFENDTLYFHRSWTGYCIYQVRFAQDANGFRTLSVEINRDLEQYRQGDNKKDLQLLNWLIDSLILQKQ